MATLLDALARHFDHGERLRLGALYAIIALMHVVGWGALLVEAARHPALLGLGGLAYGFGLRHAFDADHISAIDNTTRKLLQQGGKPVGVGFFFALGHSTVVFLIALAVGLAAKSIVEGVVADDGTLRNLGGMIGTGVSGTFLLLIGILNLIIFLDIVATYRRLHRGDLDRDALGQQVVAGGPFTRIFGRLFRMINASWQLYPLGFLFGLGFDTATEIALLAISAGAAAEGLPFLAVLALPVIFASAMTLMDTTDGAFMAKAYAWAFSNPLRKLFYNLTVTGLSVFVALFVGGLQLLHLLIQALELHGGIFDIIAELDLADLGLVLVGAFVGAWLVALAAYRLGRIEERWAALVETSEP